MSNATSATKATPPQSNIATQPTPSINTAMIEARRSAMRRVLLAACAAAAAAVLIAADSAVRTTPLVGAVAVARAAAHATPADRDARASFVTTLVSVADRAAPENSNALHAASVLTLLRIATASDVALVVLAAQPAAHAALALLPPIHSAMPQRSKFALRVAAAVPWVAAAATIAEPLLMFIATIAAPIMTSTTTDTKLAPLGLVASLASQSPFSMAPQVIANGLGALAIGIVHCGIVLPATAIVDTMFSTTTREIIANTTARYAAWAAGKWRGTILRFGFGVLIAIAITARAHVARHQPTLERLGTTNSTASTNGSNVNAGGSNNGGGGRRRRAAGHS